MALLLRASGREALGFWARTVASSTKRFVRRRSPSSAAANSLTAQVVVSGRLLMPGSYGYGFDTGDTSPHHTPSGSKIKNVGNWQVVKPRFQVLAPSSKAKNTGVRWVVSRPV